MKIVFIVTTLFITTAAFTQENNKRLQLGLKHQNKYLDLLKRERNPDVRTSSPKAEPLKPTTSIRTDKNFYLLPNGNKAYSLSQDHMPCIVPDMGQFPNIGVVKSYNYKGPGAIPNPADSLNLFQN